MAVRAVLEPATLRTEDADLTTVPPRPKCLSKFLVSIAMNVFVTNLNFQDTDLSCVYFGNKISNQSNKSPVSLTCLLTCTCLTF